MWSGTGKVNSVAGKKGAIKGLVAIAIDKDKNSQYALKWAIDTILTKGQTVVLLHVLHRSSTVAYPNNYALHDFKGPAMDKQILDKPTKELFLTFHCFCIRKEIHCFDVVLEDTDVARAITDYCGHAAIEHLVLGASRHGFMRLKTADIPTAVCKIAPDFCSIYVISKSKVSSVRNASRSAPFSSPLINRIQQMQILEKEDGGILSPERLKQSPKGSETSTPTRRSAVCSETSTPRRSIGLEGSTPPRMSIGLEGPRMSIGLEGPRISIGLEGPRMSVGLEGPRMSIGLEGSTPRTSGFDEADLVRSPFARGRAYNKIAFMDFSESDTDISFISSDRPSFDRPSFDRPSLDRPSLDWPSADVIDMGRLSDSSLGSMRSGSTFNTDFENDDVVRRLKLELQKTMDMYSTACKEALTAKQQAVEHQQWRKEEERKVEEAQVVEAARLILERDKAKYVAAQRIVEMESHKRASAMKSSMQESGGNDEVSVISSFGYRKYSIEEIEEATEYFAESRKIGEGGYGPVFKCYLDHTQVAVKVLHPNAAQGRSQFQQEVEVLSCMRHPNMVLLLGACQEYGCLVYEYMANGSLEDRLFCRGNTRPLSWQLRFRIAAEIAIGLHFLHQTKPEPLVHRDLKPANILLDQNYVSKIGDVGLARLVPPDLADDVTQYRMTSAAGTFCYIDPEYQHTGMLGVKSDVYSLGILLLQLITAKPAMGLTHYVGQAVENGKLGALLDPAVTDWPVEEVLVFAKLALQCAEMRRKDRPDLGKVVLPELNRLREFGQEKMRGFFVGGGAGVENSYVPTRKESYSFPDVIESNNPSQEYPSSASLPEKQSETEG